MLFLSFVLQETWHAMSEVAFSSELNYHYSVIALGQYICIGLVHLVFLWIDVLWRLWYLFFKQSESSMKIFYEEYLTFSMKMRL